MADKIAVLLINGRQYVVSEGKKLLVDKLEGDKVDFQTLLFADGDNIKLGKPTLPDIKLKLKVLESEVKGDKIKIFKYKSKSRYRKRAGFRPKYTSVLVESLS